MTGPPPSTHRIDTDIDGAPVLVKRSTDEAGRGRLTTEATLLEALAHPGTVRVVALVEEVGAVELHLAWAGSHTLATITGVPAAGAAALVAQLAVTVADLHRAGIAHRRLTPDHVILGPQGQAVLTGLSDAGRADEEARAADVAALGALLDGLAGPTGDGLDLPVRRRGSGRRAQRDLRGALLTLADRAQADDPRTRPDAAELAALLESLTGSVHPPRRPRPPLDRAGPLDAPGPEGATTAARWRRPVTALLVAGGLALGLGGTALVAVDQAGSGDVASPAGPGPSPTRSDPPPPATTSTTTAPLSTAGTPEPPPTAPVGPGPAGCPPISAPGAGDIDGDGCPEAVQVDGERVSAGSTTWVVGRAGDRPTVGDWDCDGTATAAVLRPDTGEVFVYHRWAGPGAEVTVHPTTRVPGADTLAGSDPDGDGCPQLVATGPGGLAVAIEGGPR